MRTRGPLSVSRMWLLSHAVIDTRVTERRRAEACLIMASYRVHLRLDSIVMWPLISLHV